MRLYSLLIALLAVSLPTAAVQAGGMPELPPDLPVLTLPDSIPDDVDRLPTLPDLAELFPLPMTAFEAYGDRPDLGVPLGPPSPLPPEGLPPGLMLGPPAGVPDGNPHFSPVPEPGTGLLTALGLALIAATRRRSIA